MSPSLELTPAEISQHLCEYQSALCRYLNLAQPTPRMVSILTRTNLLNGRTSAIEAQARAATINFQLWREADLAARLDAGVSVPGIARQADGQGFEIKPPKNLSYFSTWALPIIITNRDTATGAALVEKKIAEARQTLAQQTQAGVTFTGEQLVWLRRIKDHLATSLTITPGDFELEPFVSHGGFARANGEFDGRLVALLDELTEELVA